MDNNVRFSMYLAALSQYISRESHACVPSGHIEILDGKDIQLGTWVSYVRQRHRKGLLHLEHERQLASIPEWQWGPLRRGPKLKNERNQKILEMRRSGHSITQISDEFNISRQRVHQIVKKNAS
jgi:DNA-binding NarL/FixJ family response regulator